jgi:hypothetical protein
VGVIMWVMLTCVMQLWATSCVEKWSLNKQIIYVQRLPCRHKWNHEVWSSCHCVRLLNSIRTSYVLVMCFETHVRGINYDLSRYRIQTVWQTRWGTSARIHHIYFVFRVESGSNAYMQSHFKLHISYKFCPISGMFLKYTAPLRSVFCVQK